MKRIFTLLCLSLASLASFAQQTFVPDDAFEQKLIDLGFDDVLDDYVLTSNISSRTYLWIADRGITDLTGIEDFVSLSTLWAKGNSITTADLSTLSKLKNLYLNSNELETVILNPNAPLERYWCSKNKLTEVDISPFDELIHFYCGTNNLTSLDMRNGTNTQLVEYDFANNPDLTCVSVDDPAYSIANWSAEADAHLIFTKDCSERLTYVPDDAFEQRLIDLGFDNGILDNYVPTDNISSRTYLWIADKGIKDLTGIEDFVSLSTLWAKGNSITTADLSTLSKLKNLYLNSNELETVILNPNAPLERYWCSKNKLAEVDISPFDELIHFYCGTNNLTSLDMRNGANTQLLEYDFRGNAGLTCIEVDEPIFSAANWTKKDADVMYSVKCGYTYVPDDAFESALIELGYDDVLDDYVLTANISGVEELLLHERGILSMEGLEGFESLKFLNVNRNGFDNIDLSSLSNLTGLFCEYNELTELNTSNNLRLDTLLCRDNKLEMLDFSDNKILKVVLCANNNLKSINLDGADELESLLAFNNELETLDFTNNHLMKNIWCFTNRLNEVSLKNILDVDGLSILLNNNPDLYCVEVDDPVLAATKWKVGTFPDVDPQVVFSTDCGSSPRESVELTNEVAVTVVPNTVTDYMHVTLEHSAASYDLYDMSGSKVKSGELLEGGNDLDLSDLSSGAYILKVYTSSSVTEERIIKL